jgi:hypothetical protein
MPFRTVHIPGFVNAELAAGLYEALAACVPWHEGVRSRRGFTRLAYGVRRTDDENLPPEFFHVVNSVMHTLGRAPEALAGVYINYYETGEHYCPTHSHRGTIQAIVSLGATRTLTVGTRTFRPASGDLIVFGASAHGVPREAAAGGRISIALFIAT